MSDRLLSENAVVEALEKYEAVAVFPFYTGISEAIAIIRALPEAGEPCPTNHMRPDRNKPWPQWWRYWKDDGVEVCPDCGALLGRADDQGETP